ncbi:MAG: DUF3592 domain-containing protein [Oscillospiraceae bacterium]|nr:DUF3592 domain-containing protein [Oscillospiraceae bacterium]
MSVGIVPSIIGVVLSIFGLIFLKALLKARKILEQGNSTMATVIRYVVTQNNHGKARNRGLYKFYYAVFEYTVGGISYEHQNVVGNNKPKYEIGEKVEIYYDPSNPAEVTLEGSQKATKVLMLSFGAGGVLFLLVGVLIWI